MTHKHYWYQKQHLDFLFQKSASLKENDELLAHWSRYLCVLVSGWLQVAVYEIYSDYARKRASENVSSYVSKRLKKFQNPKMNNILSLTSDFSSDWKDALKGATHGEIKDAVDSIVKNRHQIAHGESCNISYERLKRYYEKAVIAIELLEKQCNP
jgi:hypothetical protein